MRKKNYTIIIIACITFLCAYILYKIKKDNFLHHQLKNVVAAKTNQLYKIHYDSIAVNEVEGDLFIKDLNIKGDTSLQLQMLNSRDTNAAKFILDIYIPILKVKNFKTARALLSKQLECKQVIISNAKVYLYLFPAPAKPKDAKKQQQELYKQILGNFKLIRADDISLINSEVIVKDFYTKEVKLHTFNTTIGLTDVAIDSTFNQDTMRTLFCKEIEIQSDKVILGDKNKTAEITNASFDTRSKIVAFEKFEYDAFKSNGFFKSKLEGILLQGISWTGPVENSDLIIKKAVFEKGELEALTGKSSDKKKSSKISKPILTGWINRFSLDTLKLKSLTYIKRKAESKDKPFTLRNNSFLIKNINISRTSALDESLISNAEEIVLSNDEISLTSPDKLYEYRITGMKLNSLHKNIFIKEARIIPRFNEPDFVKKAHYQTDRFDISIRHIDCKGADIGKLIKGEIDINNITATNNSVKVFRDLSYPKDTLSNRGPQKDFPHQLLNDLSFKIKINRLIATKTYIEYKEKNAKTNSSGRVRFSNSALTINNLSNHSENTGEKTTCVFATTFLDKIPVTGSFTFFIDNWKKGKFTVSAAVNNSFDAAIFNQLTEPMSLIKIEKGVVGSLKFEMTADTSVGQASLILPYENMKIHFLKKKGSEYKNKAIFSFLTNLALKNNNKPGPGMRTSNITLKHKKFKSFFNYIWSSMLTGIKDISILKI